MSDGHHFHFHLFGSQAGRTLGLVPAEDRRVKTLPASLAALVPQPTDNNLTIKPAVPDTEKDTMPLIIQKAKRTAWQTAKLAAALKGNSLSDTLANDSRFILDYIKYKKDDPDHEQIRSPRRLVADRAGDCDCFAVTLATLLINQGIKFKFRIAKYEQGDWAHIYIIVPNNQKSLSASDLARTEYTVLDPVTNKHNYEVPFVAKKDYDMSGKGLGSLQYLDGFPGTGGVQYLHGCAPASNRKNEMIPLKALTNRGLIATSNVLQQTINLVTTPAPNGEYLITTPQGDTKKLPAVLTPDQANLVTQLDASSSPSAASNAAPSATTPPAAADDNRWKWLIGIAAALALLSGTSGQKPALAGVAGRKTISHYKI